MDCLLLRPDQLLRIGHEERFLVLARLSHDDADAMAIAGAVVVDAFEDAIFHFEDDADAGLMTLDTGEIAGVLAVEMVEKKPSTGTSTSMVTRRCRNKWRHL